LPPPKRVEMEAFYRVLKPMEWLKMDSRELISHRLFRGDLPCIGYLLAQGQGTILMS
jgi:hypothetical protein